MKLRTIVKIAITSSVVLLCAGFALYSFFRLSAAEGKKDFNLYELVPPSASAVFVTDDILEFVAEVDDLACSKNQQYLHVSKLFSYLKQYLYTLQEEAPHGLSRQMNQMLISFHEPDNIHNQVLYCRLGEGFCQCFSTDELCIQLHKILRYTGKNIDQKYDRDTVSNTFFRNTLTDPHKECASCGQCAHNDCRIDKIKFNEKSLTSESDCHCSRLDQCKNDRHISCDRRNLLSSIRTLFLHIFQFRNRDRQKLHDNR